MRRLLAIVAALAIWLGPAVSEAQFSGGGNRGGGCPAVAISPGSYPSCSVTVAHVGALSCATAINCGTPSGGVTLVGGDTTSCTLAGGDTTTCVGD